ncbi:hypothetical protein DPEC_G00304530 [Dallia pectoralis]|uniref:Uncharacterized protein n=1 Tax=Dallia pectoralis TaxID=75939 RepID=A0ACC2FDM7_DALPE|nr:hypothetical protein DPEC_G00304530 [Dallia pectoralis]
MRSKTFPENKPCEWGTNQENWRSRPLSIPFGSPLPATHSAKAKGQIGPTSARAEARACKWAGLHSLSVSISLFPCAWSTQGAVQSGGEHQSRLHTSLIPNKHAAHLPGEEREDRP